MNNADEAGSKRRFIVLNLENSTKWDPISMADMFKECFTRTCCCTGESCRCNEEEWNICNLASGDDMPMDIDTYKAVVLTGSRFNCRDGPTLPWFEPVCEVVQRAAKSGKPRIYGGCFGCQVVAHALGGKVDYNPNGNFVLKADDIKLDTYVFEQYLGSMNSNSICLINSHGDCVRELPPGSDLLAYSDNCTHEMFVTGGNRNILGVQAHPEFEYQYSIAERIWPAVVDTRNKLTTAEIEDSKASFARYTDEDARKFMAAVSKFLRE